MEGELKMKWTLEEKIAALIDEGGVADRESAIAMLEDMGQDHDDK